MNVSSLSDDSCDIFEGLDSCQDFAKSILDELESNETLFNQTGNSDLDVCNVTESELSCRQYDKPETKLSCIRENGCDKNLVKIVGGGTKIIDGFGSKYIIQCQCGLKWQENNWKERQRLQDLGVSDVRCITLCKPNVFKKKRIIKCSKCGQIKKNHTCTVTVQK